jgi:hypothetical protein
MHLQVCRREEKGRNIRALTRLTGKGMARRGEGRGRTTCAWIVHWNPAKAAQVHGFLLPFIFAMSLCQICFDKDRPSRLWDAVTLGGSSL